MTKIEIEIVAENAQRITSALCKGSSPCMLSSKQITKLAKRLDQTFSSFFKEVEDEKGE